MAFLWLLNSRFVLKTTETCFHYWNFLTNFWRNNWRSIFDVVERLWEKAKKLPETDVGAFWSVKKKIEFFGLFLHLFDLIGCQIHQAIDLFLKAFHSLLSKIDITAKRLLIHNMNRIIGIFWDYGSSNRSWYYDCWSWGQNLCIIVFFIQPYGFTRPSKTRHHKSNQCSLWQFKFILTKTCFGPLYSSNKITKTWI